MTKFRVALHDLEKSGIKLEAITNEVIQVFPQIAGSKIAITANPSTASMKSVVPPTDNSVGVTENLIEEKVVVYDFSDENKLIEVCKFFPNYSYTHNYFHLKLL
jgi:hypothetical protein